METIKDISIHKYESTNDEDMTNRIVGDKVVEVWTLKQNAIKWINPANTLEHPILKLLGKTDGDVVYEEDMKQCEAIIKWIKYFFNIAEEDFKKPNQLVMNGKIIATNVTHPFVEEPKRECPSTCYAPIQTCKDCQMILKEQYKKPLEEVELVRTSMKACFCGICDRRMKSNGIEIYCEYAHPVDEGSPIPNKEDYYKVIFKFIGRAGNVINEVTI